MIPTMILLFVVGYLFIGVAHNLERVEDVRYLFIAL